MNLAKAQSSQTKNESEFLFLESVALHVSFFLFLTSACSAPLREYLLDAVRSKALV